MVTFLILWKDETETKGLLYLEFWNILIDFEILF